MINEQGLWRGDAVVVEKRSRDNGDGDVYAVMLRRRWCLAEFFNKDWANAFAEVTDSLVPPGAGHENAFRYVNDGLLSLASMRFLLASVLERAAERHLARSLEDLDDRSRESHRQIAQALKEQAAMLTGEALR